MREEKNLGRRVGRSLLFPFLLLAACLVAGAGPGRCAGAEEVRQGAVREVRGEAPLARSLPAPPRGGLHGLFPRVLGAWSTLGAGAEFNSFAVAEDGTLTRSVTWPVVHGPVNVSLGGAATLGGRLRAGPFLLFRIVF